MRCHVTAAFGCVGHNVGELSCGSSKTDFIFRDVIKARESFTALVVAQAVILLLSLLLAGRTVQYTNISIYISPCREICLAFGYWRITLGSSKGLLTLLPGVAEG